jgi:hypothetical protein
MADSAGANNRLLYRTLFVINQLVELKFRRVFANLITVHLFIQGATIGYTDALYTTCNCGMYSTPRLVYELEPVVLVCG